MCTRGGDLDRELTGLLTKREESRDELLGHGIGVARDGGLVYAKSAQHVRLYSGISELRLSVD
eukprot:scaffold31318_cov28-Tisochrysis_lutea.AAC.6